MSSRLERYRTLVAERPELFTQPDDGVPRLLLDPEAMAEAEEAGARGLAALGMDPSWAETGVVFEDQYVMVLRDAVDWGSGFLGTYIRLLPKTGSDRAGVVVVALVDDEVVLVEHFRHATRQWMLELPRGFGEPGQDAFADARRELEEEVEAVIEHVEVVGRAHVDGGLLGSYVSVVVARCRSIGEPARGEGIRAARAVPIAEVWTLVRAGAITDGMTLLALALATASGAIAPPAP
ncbi:MAG TPA: NUDIX hydrolase [Iamia sp.]